MKRDNEFDAESILRAYWRDGLDSISAPADVMEKALARARNQDRFVAEGRFEGPLKRALVRMAGLSMVLAVGGLWLFYHPGNNLAGSHQSAAGTAFGDLQKAVQANAPFTPLAGSVAALTRSTGQHLWALQYAEGSWKLWTQRSIRAPWRLERAVPGLGRTGADLTFSGREGWLLTPAGDGWQAWQTSNDGAVWTRAALPYAHGYANAALSIAGGATYLAFSGNSSKPAALYRASSGGWQRLSGEGLPRDIAGIQFASPDVGYALAGGTTYATADAGRQWFPAATNATLAETSSTFGPAVPNPSAPDVMSAAALGLTTRLGSVTWTVVRDQVLQITSHSRIWRPVGTLPFSGGPQSFVFVTKRMGYIVANSGRVWVTKNGGRTWNVYKGG